MKIYLSPRAEKELRKLSKLDQLAVAKKIRSLQQPVQINVEKLAGFINIYRLRVGNYRIVYRKNNIEIYVILIGHRKEIYHILSRIIQ